MKIKQLLVGIKAAFLTVGGFIARWYGTEIMVRQVFGSSLNDALLFVLLLAAGIVMLILAAKMWFKIATRENR